MIVVFDLDDTLYKEVDFLQSAYREIARRVQIPAAYDLMWKTWQAHGDAFETLLNVYPLPFKKTELLDIYRYHTPDIVLSEGVMALLDALQEKQIEVGILTDGRTRTQMNKIKTLGLLDYVKPKHIVISESFGSEKPAQRNFKHFMDSQQDCIYVADNPKKDFLAPNQLGWKTICLLNDGRNIHPQNFELPNEYLPQQCIKDFSNVASILSLL